ncbi:hypothetical protein NEOLEDRAFT_1181694 [Neolentinus lepideus HHB14362 ss-1]|uniref:Uncharacterized protein n=1 Tax=Neolentinus lepideus HHB14362 ss-1 TaxID=1314782 RepID=A0A165PUY9_9AGAM|nr:hypothetical protein NEOLEDRAFT_1181694 [Neolentinus lepideus HHB14362 ss-1]
MSCFFTSRKAFLGPADLPALEMAEVVSTSIDAVAAEDTAIGDPIVRLPAMNAQCYDGSSENYALSKVPMWVGPGPAVAQHPSLQTIDREYFPLQYGHNNALSPGYHQHWVPPMPMATDTAQLAHPLSTMEVYSPCTLITKPETVQESLHLQPQEYPQELTPLLESEQTSNEASGYAEPELVTHWPPRLRASSFRFNPFHEEDDQARLYLATVNGYPEPVLPENPPSSTTSTLLTPFDNVESTWLHAIGDDRGKSARPNGANGDRVGGEIQGLHGLQTASIGEKMTDVPMGDNTGTSNRQTPMGVLKRKDPNPTKGNRRLERRVRFAKMNHPRTDEDVEVVIEREANKYLDLLEYLSYRATVRVKANTLSDQDCDTLPLLPLWLHFPDFLPAVFDTHKENISLLRLCRH